MDIPLSVTEPAPAKINLALHVTGRRADGYHLLESLVVFARLGDRVTARAAAADAFAVEGPFAAALPADGGENLVARARDALRRAASATPRSFAPPRSGRDLAVAIRLTKNLPVASGIGGGSSDAAAALRALSRLWGLDLAPERLAALGLALGADVPMCLAARPLKARGVGEVLEPVDGLPPLALVLANPGVAVPTPAVFAALAVRENPPLPPLPARPDFRRLAEWLAAARNDLETPATAVAPVVADVLAALRARGAALARMSGSGATCFGLFSTPAEAEGAAAAIRRARPGWFVAATETL